LRAALQQRTSMHVRILNLDVNRDAANTATTTPATAGKSTWSKG